MWEEEEYFNHESILIVNEKGVLKRLKTPFKVVLIDGVDDLKAGEIYSVMAVITNSEDVLVYAIGVNCYYYYWFMIL